MSRLRRTFHYDRYFFVTVALLKSRRRLYGPDFEPLAPTLKTLFFFCQPLRADR